MTNNIRFPVVSSKILAFFAVKGVNFFGLRSEFVVSGSDCGHVFVWDKETQNVVNYMKGDETGVVSTFLYLNFIANR